MPTPSLDRTAEADARNVAIIHTDITIPGRGTHGAEVAIGYETLCSGPSEYAAHLLADAVDKVGRHALNRVHGALPGLPSMPDPVVTVLGELEATLTRARDRYRDVVRDHAERFELSDAITAEGHANGLDAAITAVRNQVSTYQANQRAAAEARR